MNKRLLFPLLLLTIGSIIILHSCFYFKSEVKTVNPAFAQLISGYTSGMQSRKTTIRIELAAAYNEMHLPVNSPNGGNNIDLNPVAWEKRNMLPDSTLLEGIFSFDPAIKGRARWVSDRIVEFIPDQLLPVDQFYNGIFRLYKVRKVSSELEEFPIQFSTYPQSISVSTDGLENYEEYAMEWQRLSGKLTTADIEDTNAIKKIINIQYEGKSLPVKWKRFSSDHEFVFYVDSIRRKIKEEIVIVSWDGAPVKAIQKGQQEVKVHGLGDFTMVNARVEEGDDQYVNIRFSDPIDPNQNLKGIIRLEGVENFSTEVEGNEVKLFFSQRISGHKMLKISTGLKNFRGYKMNVAANEMLHFYDPYPMVRIKNGNCILPDSKGLIFPFEAASLRAVYVRVIKIYENNVHQFLQVNNLNGSDGLTRVGKVIAEKKISLAYNPKMKLTQWNKHVIDLKQLIHPDPGAIYRVSIKFKKEDAICDCELNENSEEEKSSTPDEDVNWSEKDWNGYGFDGDYDDWYDYYETESPCDERYYYGKGKSKNILASNIGMIYKLDDNKLSHAFITDMITAKPIANAQVEYYDFVKQLLAYGTTDAQGMLDLQLKRKPFLMIVKYGKQRGYLKLEDGETNSLSKFDVSGEVVQKGVKGFIYGERGVWRPGDSLFLSFIIEDKEHRLPQKHPVKFELIDPNNQVVYQTTKTKHLNGMYDFRTATVAEAVTGYYRAVVTVGNRTFSQMLKIETVKPNRLKIYLDFEKDKMNDSTARLQVKWLHGATASKLHATVNVAVSPTVTHFSGYPGFTFDSPIRSFSSDASLVFDGNLDEKGEAVIKKNIEVDKSSAGMLKASYTTKVFEEGGDFSIDRYTTTFSPYKSYVGLETPPCKNYDHTFETGKTYSFNVATVNEKGNAVNKPKIQVKVYRMQWRWWYEKDETEVLATYIARGGSIVMIDTIIQTHKGRGSFTFRVNYPEYGRYLITVADPESGHETGKLIYVDWPYWSRANRSNSENANLLNFASDKERYVAGEQVKLSFPSPSEGMALISIESGTRVLKKWWVPTKKGETVCQFPATANMAPNAYVHITMIQPHASTQNDLPIRMFGLLPILVDDPATHLSPEISMMDVIRPESVITINVKEKKGRRMTYTVAMVDDGLLDLTRFKTPQPWSTFYAREALGVKTWDMYDAVIGAYAGRLDRLLSIGGDGDEANAKGVKANRFKPIVRFMGPFCLEPGQEKLHKVHIPNYVGSLRVMVVAGDNGAYGNAEKTVAVRKPLMLLATMPRVVGPGEKISLPVDVFAMEEHLKDVKVEVEVNELFQIEGSKQQSLHFERKGDEVVNFSLKVAERTGLAHIRIIAISGKERAVQEIELDVRTPNPKTTMGIETIIEPGKTVDFPVVFSGVNGTNLATLECSGIPAIGLEKRLSYLIQYPHGCIEQTTSSVFPQLFLASLIDVKEVQKNRIHENIKAGLKRLQLFQTSSGGFSYWPGEVYPSDWGSNYAGHFMLEAESKGYNLPINMKAKWLSYQQQQARNWSPDKLLTNNANSNDNGQLIQAYRLFVLALSRSAELGAMNRLREEKNLSNTARWRLASAYYLIGQEEVALTLVRNLPVMVAPYQELSYSYGSDERDRAMILETLSLLKERNRAEPLAREISKALSSDSWMNTQETAYSLLAMCAYVGAKEQFSEMSFTYSLNGNKSFSMQSKKCFTQFCYSDKDINKEGKIAIKNTGKGLLFVKLMVEGVPLVGDAKVVQTNLQMTMVFKSMKGEIIQPDRLIQGTDFMAVVTLTNPGTKGDLKEMVLSQVFPSGWEIHNNRMDELASDNPSRFQDIRDDRIYSYYDLAAKSSKTFVIRLNATYLGKYYLPTLYSEAMYDHLINARIPGKWVEVVKGP